MFQKVDRLKHDLDAVFFEEIGCILQSVDDRRALLRGCLFRYACECCIDELFAAQFLRSGMAFIESLRRAVRLEMIGQGIAAWYCAVNRNSKRMQLGEVPL